MPMSSLKAGVHYPGNLAAVRAWFPDDAACLDYLDWLRWSDGFRCTHCGCEKGWRLPAGGWSCAGCRKRVRVLAGTIFQDTRTPLTVWFEAAWLMAVTKNGVSAASLQPLLGLGSYETAWVMCHKLRTAMRTVSHEAIYRFVYALPAGELARHAVMLRSKRTRRRRVKPLGERGAPIVGMVSIYAREDVADRRVPGHWGLLPAPMRPDEVLRVPGKGRRRAQHLVSEQEGHVAEPVAAHLQVQRTEDVPGLEVPQPAVHQEDDRQDGKRPLRDDQ